MTKISEFSAETKAFTSLPYLTVYKNNNIIESRITCSHIFKKIIKVKSAVSF